LGQGLAILCGRPQAHRALEDEVMFKIEAKACANLFLNSNSNSFEDCITLMFEYF
jgi:hypothetical protein